MIKEDCNEIAIILHKASQIAERKVFHCDENRHVILEPTVGAHKVGSVLISPAILAFPDIEAR